MKWIVKDKDGETTHKSFFKAITFIFIKYKTINAAQILKYGVTIRQNIKK